MKMILKYYSGTFINDVLRFQQVLKLGKGENALFTINGLETQRTF